MTSSPHGLPQYRGRSHARWQRHANYWLWRLEKRSEDPEVIARGVAVGMFAGVLPMLGQSFVAIALASLVGGSRIIAAAMTFVSNPATTFPIFLFDYWLGCQILGKAMLGVEASDFESWESFSALGVDFVVTIFLGGAIAGALAGVASYFPTRVLAVKLKERRSQRQKRLVAVNGIATEHRDEANAAERVG